MSSLSCPFSRKTVRVNLLVTFQTKRFGFTSGRFSIFSRLSDLWLLWVKYFTGHGKNLFFYFISTGWYSWLGFWAMLHVPVHFVVFLILLLIIPLEIYLVFLIFVLSKYLKEAYIDVSSGSS